MIFVTIYSSHKKRSFPVIKRPLLITLTIVNERGFFSMAKDKTFLEVNDYLDLYLLAGSLNDKAWQQQILEKLKDVPKENNKKEREITLNIEKMTQEYRQLNIDIIDLYRELRKDPGNIVLRNKLSRLEQTSKYLSKKIHVEENKLEHLTSN